MLGRTVFVFILALATALAEPLLSFPENVRSEGRIVSGWEAREGQFPFQLSLRIVNPVGAVTGCGASIVHSEWAITAAHCTATRVTVVIRAGAVSLTRPYYIFETTEYYNHPLYNEAMQGIVQPNDIGLLKFNRQLQFNHRVAPIRVQRSEDRNRNYAGDRLTASGWGLTWTQGSSPENLNWVFLSGTTNAECWLAFGGSSIVVDSTICARGYNDTTQSTCSGDSGGPLTVVDGDGGLTLVGVASFVSAAGCHVDLPAGFIRPGHYHDWFTQVTGINFDWEDFEEPTTLEPQPTTTLRPEPEPQPTTTQRPEPEPQPSTTILPEPSTTLIPEPEPQPSTTLIPEPEPQPSTTLIPEPEPQPSTTLLPEPEPQPSTTLIPEPEPQPSTTLIPEPEPQPSTTLIPEPEPQPSTTLIPEPEPQPSTTLIPEPELQPSTTLIPEPEPQPSTTLLPEPEPQPSTTLLPEPEPQPSTTLLPGPEPQPSTTLLPGPEPQPPTTLLPEPSTTLLPEPEPQPSTTERPEPELEPSTTVLWPEAKKKADEANSFNYFKSLFFYKM